MRDHWKFDVSATGQGKVWRNGGEVKNVQSAVIRVGAGELTKVELVHTSADVELAVETYPEQGLHEYCDYWRWKADRERYWSRTPPKAEPWYCKVHRVGDQ